MNKNNGDGTVTFTFTISNDDAMLLMTIIQNDIGNCRFKAMEELSNGNAYMAKYYNLTADYVVELKKKILTGE
jgi:hypothetical protein